MSTFCAIKQIILKKKNKVKKGNSYIVNVNMWVKYNFFQKLSSQHIHINQFKVGRIQIAHKIFLVFFVVNFSSMI